MEDSFKAALHQAQGELETLEQRRSVLLRLIQNLKELSEDEAYELTPPPGYVPQGLTEEIRTILSITTVHLTPMEIRDSLITRGFKASSPKNLLINVHTVISRLHDARELSVAQKDGKPAYKRSEQITALAQLANIDPNLLPEEVRAIVKPPLTPGEAKRRMESLRPKK
ncbi:hypothetical protein SBA1_100080 [Candidatus Sulfotelmatobacter kueseliae]|uniref:Uncharacterized protein n=1 Tax=Candidatus Sulfotelmatobacter kueseliae TaxID=2042962 RepID=A0A2U3JW37_9BACT|nr:hypothetical protein SBA1_100080 [Candidatus Sulfotelmatobacter kueseliae]